MLPISYLVNHTVEDGSNCSRELRVGVHRYAPASVNAAELFRWRPDARRCDRGTGPTADVLTASRRPDGWLIEIVIGASAA
jgi:hypothetical protein